MLKVPHASVVWNIMYSMICTRVDVTYVASMRSYYMENPRKGYWEVLKWLFRYLSGTTNYDLLFIKMYSIDEKNKMVVYI